MISYQKLVGKNIQITSDEIFSIKSKLRMIKNIKVQRKNNVKDLHLEIKKTTPEIQMLLNKLMRMINKLYNQKKGYGLIFVILMQ